MDRIILFKSIIFVLHVFCLQNVHSAVQKIDLIVWQKNRFVDLTESGDEEYRGYVSKDYKAITTFNIGRTSNTGTGDVGEEVENPTDGDTLPSNSGFPSGSAVAYVDREKSRRINVKLGGSGESKGRVGAFYVKAVHDNSQTVQITTIKTAAGASITSLHDTLSASVGDRITLQVKTNLSIDTLRWSHNGNPPTDAWKGKKEITLRNVRKGDEGIYECYQDGQHGNAVHAIMRLIVRACPAGKYGSQCEGNCPACYNGGICHDETGKCVCPTGFMGENCETDCGCNRFGADCSIPCQTPEWEWTSGCRSHYFCVPDPVGCSCAAGFTGVGCRDDCPSGKYGSDCMQTCYCMDGCDPSRGCTKPEKCIVKYGGPQCQVPPSCQEGYYGDLCKYKCHCQGDVGCNRSTGACKGQCAEGWAGSDCQQALPSLYGNPVVEMAGNKATLRWQPWDPTIDYGTGPVEKYNVYYGESGHGLPKNITSEDSEEVIYMSKAETDYEFALSVFRVIEGSLQEGQMGNVVTHRTGCKVPTASPSISDIFVLGTSSVEIIWTVPPGSDWIGCSLGIASFVITYNDVKLPSVLTTIDALGSDDRVQIHRLNPCTEYAFVIRITNKDHVGPNSDIRKATTDNSAPGQVQSLHVKHLRYDILNILWNAPTSLCEVSGYVVSHELTLQDQCRLPSNPQRFSSDTKATEKIFTQLQAFSNYTIEVYAKSGRVKGPKRIINVTTGEMAPSGPPSEVRLRESYEEIKLCWKPPPCGSRHGNVIDYEYVFGKLTERTVDLCKVFKLNSLYDAEYTFQVSAATSAGPGPPTNLITVSVQNPAGGLSTVLRIVVTISSIVFIAIGIKVWRWFKNKKPGYGNVDVDQSIRGGNVGQLTQGEAVAPLGATPVTGVSAGPSDGSQNRNTKVTDKDISNIVNVIQADELHSVYVEFGLSDKEVERAEQQAITPEEKARKVFIRWRQMNGSSATRGKILDALKAKGYQNSFEELTKMFSM